MRIHFVGIGTNVVCSLAIALKERNYQVTCSDDKFSEQTKIKLEKVDVFPSKTGWFPEKINSNIDVIIFDINVNSENPELKKAKDLNLKIYSYPEFLYQIFKDKTRIAITGVRERSLITSIILHIIGFHNKNINYIAKTHVNNSDVEVKISDENDFALFDIDENILSEQELELDFLSYKPNIALISDIKHEYIHIFQDFVDSITSGGVIIYNQKDAYLTQIIEKTSNCLRKIPYKSPNYEILNNKINILTEIGKIPLSIIDEHNLQCIEASRHLCQQLGIMETEFYEALMSF